MVRLWPRGLPPDPGLFTEYPIAACVEPGGFNLGRFGFTEPGGFNLGRFGYLGRFGFGGFNLGRFGFTEQACVSTQAHLIAKLRGLPTEAEPS